MAPRLPPTWMLSCPKLWPAQPAPTQACASLAAKIAACPSPFGPSATCLWGRHFQSAGWQSQRCCPYRSHILPCCHICVLVPAGPAQHACWGRLTFSVYSLLCQLDPHLNPACARWHLRSHTSTLAFTGACARSAVSHLYGRLHWCLCHICRSGEVDRTQIDVTDKRLFLGIGALEAASSLLGFIGASRLPGKHCLCSLELHAAWAHLDWHNIHLSAQTQMGTTMSRPGPYKEPLLGRMAIATELRCNTNIKALMGFTTHIHRPAGPGTLIVCSPVHDLKALTFAKPISAANMQCRGHSGPPVAEHHLLNQALSCLIASLCVCTHQGHCCLQCRCHSAPPVAEHHLLQPSPVLPGPAEAVKQSSGGLRTLGARSWCALC